jgi:hypothetical protein
MSLRCSFCDVVLSDYGWLSDKIRGQYCSEDCLLISEMGTKKPYPPWILVRVVVFIDKSIKGGF